MNMNDDEVDENLEEEDDESYNGDGSDGEMKWDNSSGAEEEEEEEEEEGDDGDGDDWSTSTNSISISHHNVFCDECGVHPIVGTRYKSTIQNNYDICQECLEENHNNDASGFVSFEEPIPEHEAVEAAGFQEDNSRGLTFECLEDLVGSEILQDPNSRVDDITLFLWSTHGGNPSPDPDPTTLERARNMISNHTQLKEMEIQVLHGARPEEVIAIVQGLQRNASIQSIAWTITLGAGLPDQIYQAIKDLMGNNQNIRFMFVFGDHHFVFWDDHFPSTVQHEDNVKLEDCIFDGLEEAQNIDTFRFKGMAPVKDHNKKKAWNAMEHNGNLKRIKATFE
jgi:hypothetical protein